MKNIKDGITSLVNNLKNTRSAQATNTIISERLMPAEISAIAKTGLYNRIVNLKAGHSTKNGFNFDDDASEAFYQTVEREVQKAVRSMITFGRGVIVMITPNEPLSNPITSNKNLKFKAFTGDMITASTAVTDLINDRYLKPDFYYIRDRQIHWSRVVDFTYIEPPELNLPVYQYGGISEAELIHPQLIADGVVERAVPSMLEKSSSFFYKITGFANSLKQGKDNETADYLSRVEDLRSIYGAGIIDKEDGVEVLSQSLANLGDSNLFTLRRIAVVTGIPLTILLGEGAKGLQADTHVEKEVFNETIEQIQNDYILKPLGEFMEFMGYKKPEIKVSQNISPLDKANFDALVIQNAVGIYNLGEDAQIYLNKHGVISEDT